MTLEEAIEHCYEVAKNCSNKQCELDHIQLAKWLEELKQRRLNDVSTLKCGSIKES